MRILFCLPLVLLYGCTSISTHNSTPAIAKTSTAHTPVNVKSNRTFHYQCTQGKLKLTVLDNITTQHHKNPSINITFKKSKQRLLPTIAERGKRYANTQWTWSDNGHTATLTDSLARPLAENCQRLK